MATQDDSVRFALDELKRIESERLDEEARAAREREEAEARRQAEATAKREAAAAHAREVAEAEARLRLDRELETRDTESAARLARLRAELDAVRADRERLHARATGAVDPVWAERTVRSGRGWAAAFAAACVAMGALVVVLATREPVVEERIVEVPVDAPTDRATASVEPPPPAPTAVETAPAAPPTETVHRPARPVRPSHHGGLPADIDSTDPLRGLDCPEDDPLCGVDGPTAHHGRRLEEAQRQR